MTRMGSEMVVRRSCLILDACRSRPRGEENGDTYRERLLPCGTNAGAGPCHAHYGYASPGGAGEARLASDGLDESSRVSFQR